jgi:hypothetical protein
MKKTFLSILAVLCYMAVFAQNKINEGSLTYAVQWTLPPSAPPQMASMLPTEMKVVFKGDSSATLATSKMSSSSTILNPKTEYARLLLDIPMMSKKFSIIFTPADQEEMKAQFPEYELTAGPETTTMVGYQAQKYVVKDKKSGNTFDAWFTKEVDIIPNSLSNLFDKSYGFPLEFNTVQNGMGIKAIVKEVKTEKVPAGSFSATGDYEEITFEQLKGMMQGGR